VVLRPENFTRKQGRRRRYQAIAQWKVAWDVPATRERQTIFPRRQWFTDGSLRLLLHSGFGAYTSGEKQSLTC